MQDHDQARQDVAQAYAKAVQATTSAACCGGAGKGRAVRFAGYEEQALQDLPESSVVNAFGCGNPLAFSQVQPGDTVLDLGSGAGIDLLLAARAVGPEGRAIGVDMTDEMIQVARQAIQDAGVEHAEVRKGIIEALPVDTDSVDWVISNCVVNLSPEKDRVFAEIARVLKPGGRMRISDLVVEEMPEWMREDRRLYASCLGGAIREADYLDGLRRAGLVDVQVTERIVYDEAQLAAIVGDAAAGDTCSASALPELLGGRVWSAMIVARKPDATTSTSSQP